MSQKRPDFSVIVLFGRGELEPCLSSLLKQREQSFEIIGVIGADVPEVNDPRVKFLVVSEQNPAKRRNLAVADSCGKYLAFIDDDAIAPEDWLFRARTILEENPEIAGVGGSNTGFERMSWQEQITDMLLRDQYFGAGSRAYLKNGNCFPARPGMVHLSNFFLRREIFDAVKGFNEKIGYGAEDSEFVYWSKKKTGREFWFFPELCVIHKRRAFGLGFLKRNFQFRRKNGNLIWLYPDMYSWSWQIPVAGLMILLALILAILNPVSILIMSAIYYLLFFISSLLRSSYRVGLSLLMPFAYFFHHLSYLLGLSAGLLEGMFRGRKRLEELLGRED